MVLAVDEKPHNQALERAQGYLRLRNGRTLSGHSHDYKRHGTTTLCAAFDVATGESKAGTLPATATDRVPRLHEHGRGRSPGTRDPRRADKLETHKRSGTEARRAIRASASTSRRRTPPG